MFSKNNYTREKATSNGVNYLKNSNKPYLERHYNFTEVCKGKLYRSGQPGLNFLFYLKNTYRIKTIVSLCTRTEIFEQNFAKENGVRLINIPMRILLHHPKIKDIQTFFSLFENRKNCPVLLHCREGKDRTSVMVALFRLGYQKWSVKKALDEMKQWEVKLYWRAFVKFRAIRMLPSAKA